MVVRWASPREAAVTQFSERNQCFRYVRPSSCVNQDTKSVRRASETSWKTIISRLREARLPIPDAVPLRRSGPMCALICDAGASCGVFRRMSYRRFPILLVFATLFAVLIARWAEIGSGTSQQPAVAAWGEKRGAVVLVYETSRRPCPAAGAWIWRASATGAQPSVAAGPSRLVGLLEAIPFSGGPPKLIVRGPCRGSWSA
jgi:hypothetical protein